MAVVLNFFNVACGMHVAISYCGINSTLITIMSIKLKKLFRFKLAMHISRPLVDGYSNMYMYGVVEVSLVCTHHADLYKA